MTARPQPVAKSAGIVTTVATVLGLAVSYGIIAPATGDALDNAVVVGLPSVLLLSGVAHTLFAYFTAKKHTTPSKDPREEVVKVLPDGTTTTVLEPLVPVSFTALVAHDVDGTPIAVGNPDHADQDVVAETPAAPETEEGELAAAQDDTDGDQLTFDDDPTTTTALGVSA